MPKFADKPYKIKIYYYDQVVQPKPLPPIKTRVYIHRESGLWAAVRDLSQAEIVANKTVQINISLEMTVNYNPQIIKMYSDLWIEFNNKTYKLQAKPDEYNYSKSDIKLRVEEKQDPDNKITDKIYRGAI